MAQKRMFDKRITDSDKFADLPDSCKSLYFMAGMNADDRGFFQPKRLQRSYGYKDDDYKVLIAKRFFMMFESGVMVITAWNQNNYLDKNRITETDYIEELKLLKLVNEKYELLENSACLTDVKPALNQYSIEENSIVESSREEKSVHAPKGKYGQYKNVLLTKEEFDKLDVQPDGEDAIEFLSEYRERKGYKSKSDYLAIRKWVFDAVVEERRRKDKISGYKPPKQNQGDPFGDLLKECLEEGKHGIINQGTSKFAFET